jgi:hypothetical protein
MQTPIRAFGRRSPTILVHFGTHRVDPRLSVVFRFAPYATRVFVRISSIVVVSLPVMYTVRTLCYLVRIFSGHVLSVSYDSSVRIYAESTGPSSP